MAYDHKGSQCLTESILRIVIVNREYGNKLEERKVPTDPVPMSLNAPSHSPAPPIWVEGPLLALPQQTPAQLFSLCLSTPSSGPPLPLRLGWGPCLCYCLSLLLDLVPQDKGRTDGFTILLHPTEGWPLAKTWTRALRPHELLPILPGNFLFLSLSPDCT